MKEEQLSQSPVPTVGTSVIFTGLNGSFADRRVINEREATADGSRLTVRNVIPTINNGVDRIDLEFEEIEGQHNSNLFVEAVYWFKHVFQTEQTVVFTGKGPFASQIESVKAQGVKRGDELTIKRVRSNNDSVYLEFYELVDLHNGLMFCDKSFWARPC